METNIVYWGYVGDKGKENGNYYLVLTITSLIRLEAIVWFNPFNLPSPNPFQLFGLPDSNPYKPISYHMYIYI